MNIRIFVIFFSVIICLVLQSCNKEKTETDPKPTFNIPNVFSVSPNKMVYFSPGNLQFKPATQQWRFAPTQFEIIGDSNYHNSRTYNGWIDMFGWGTSGYNGKYPYLNSSSDSDYGDGNNDISGTNYDWGIYNTIYNPSTGNTDAAGTWRTLTQEEWEYILDKRQTKTGVRYAKSIVDCVRGVIIPPDNWDISLYNLVPRNTTYASFNKIIIDISDWNDIFEPSGCVFLPAAGSCYIAVNFPVYSSGRGSYWTSTHKNNTEAKRIIFDNYDFNFDLSVNRSHQNSVRLVRDY